MLVDKNYNPKQVEVMAAQVLDLTFKVTLLEEMLLSESNKLIYQSLLKLAHEKVPQALKDRGINL